MGNLKIGERIKKIRTDRGITKYNFAKSIGISDSSLANYENEFRVPSADIIYKICDVYGVSADYLIRGIEDINKNTSELLGLSDTTIERLKKFNNIPKNNSIDNKNFLPSLNLIINSKHGIFLLSEIYRYITNQYEGEQPEVIELLTGLRKAEYATQEELVKNWESWQISLITSTLNGMKSEHNKTK